MATEQIKRLMTRADIISDYVNVIAPIYFPDRTLDKNRAGTFGYITETMAANAEDSIIIEQTRAADYCPELSNNEIHVNQTAKIRGVGVERATPGTCYAILGILKNDIITKGTRYSDTERRFLIDRRSTIMYGGVNFSLDDDILVRAIRVNNRYLYTANYTMEHMVSGIMDSYLQVYEYTSSVGEELLGMVVKLSQCKHNISDQTVVDNIAFTYDGLYFPYSNRLSSFEVYYKSSPTDSEYIKAKMENYLSTASPSSKHLYYNDDETGILRIINNRWLGLSTNSIIRTEILETLGADGNITLNGVDRATFSMYQDAAYNYSGVYVYINFLTDTTGGKNGDSLDDLKKRLIDAKVRRSNITTENDILNYINDVDANIQLVKKRNDTEDRIYYLYTLLRDKENGIAPATTKPLILDGPKSESDPGGFDIYREEDRRKVLKANARFELDIDGLCGSTSANILDCDCVRRADRNIVEHLVVDPTDPPNPTQYEIGNVVRVRRTMSNGSFTDKTYRIDTHKVSNIISDCFVYPEANHRIGATAPATVVLRESPIETAEEVATVPTGTSFKVDLNSQTEGGWIRSYYIDYVGWCRTGDIIMDTIDTAVAGTKIIVDLEQSTDSFYRVYLCNRSSDRYISTRGLINGYVPKTVVATRIEDETYGERAYYLNCPYLVVVDDLDIASYYFNSVDTDAILSAQTGNTYFPLQMIARAVRIYRDSHAAENDDTYTFTIVGTMNTEDDSLLINEDGEIADPEAIMCYLFFTVDGTTASYLPMPIASYNSDTREFTFVGSIKTSDYITESGVLEITDGLFQVGTDTPWYTCDYKDASFSVYFMYKEGEDYADYATSDQIMTLLPESRLYYEEKTGARGIANKDTYLYNDPNIPPELTYEDVYTLDTVTTNVVSSRTIRAGVDGQSSFVIPTDLVNSTILSISTITRVLAQGTDYTIANGVITLIGFTIDAGIELYLTVSTPVTSAVSPYSENWFSRTIGGDPVVPQSNVIYTILTDGSYNGEHFVWDDTMNVYSLWNGNTGHVVDANGDPIRITNTTVVDIDDEGTTLEFYHVTYTDPDGNEYVGYVPKADLDYEDVMTPGGYVLMNSYYNNANNLYNLILEYGKFTRSPVTISNSGSSTYQVRAFGPIVETDDTLDDALLLIRTASNNTAAMLALLDRFNDPEYGLTEDLAAYVLNNRIKMLESGTVQAIREAWEAYKQEESHEISTEYLIEAVPFLEFLFSQDNTASLYDRFKNDADVYTALLKLTTDFEVALKYTATYGPSKYIVASGIRQDGGTETNVDLGELNPTIYFKVYGLHVDVSAIYEFIYQYLRDHYITDEVIFASNICTAVENNFPAVESIKYMGIDGANELNASYQQFTFTVPEFTSTPMITRYVPEQLNITDIRIELVETRI